MNKGQTCIALHKCLLARGEKLALVPFANTACIDVTYGIPHTTWVQASRLLYQKTEGLLVSCIVHQADLSCKNGAHKRCE